jgi:hypothetical protein
MHRDPSRLLRIMAPERDGGRLVSYRECENAGSWVDGRQPGSQELTQEESDGARFGESGYQKEIAPVSKKEWVRTAVVLPGLE